MLWLAISLFFVWCAYREIRSSLVAPPGYDDPQPITKPYLAMVIALALAFAWPPVHRWYFEHYLSRIATDLAEGRNAKVHCNTVWDTMLDTQMLAAGHAVISTGEIGLQHPWCSTLQSYLHHPQRASEEELWSLGMLTHESMHVRGEANEARTECQAVQRNYRTAKLLGVADAVAKKNALDYYNNLYQQRAVSGIMQAAYYSAQCAPGKEWDEHLADSSWGP
ncbi:MAG: hypothetical protein JSS29_18005 [Proteobacteria bacterium]|nr:hypothetical protein [Pseudomonadota bacterium]